VSQRLELLGDPERPVTVARCIADEDVGHAFPPFGWACSHHRPRRVLLQAAGEIDLRGELMGHHGPSGRYAMNPAALSCDSTNPRD
jgi:hypothetical protein